MPAPTDLPPSSWGRRWRLAVSLAALGLLIYGTVAGRDRDYPFAPMTQYAFYVAPDGEVASTQMWAETTAGTEVPVPLNGELGMRRAEVENQLTRIRAHPELLRTIVDAQQQRHPDQPQFVRLFIRQRVYPLHNRVPGPSYVRTLLTWTVPR